MMTKTTPAFELGKLQVFAEPTLHVRAAGQEGVSILLTLPDGRLLVARELRPAVGRVVWGLPGGMVEPGETAAECARRELREEFGAEVGALTHLGDIYPQPGVLDRLVHLYHARLLSLGASQPEEDETITATTISLADLQKRLAHGDPVDGELPCALYYASLRGCLA